MTIALTPNYLEMPEYNASRLLDLLQSIEGLANDAALARYLHIAPPVISKLRRHVIPVTDALLVRMHEVSGLPIADLKRECGIPPIDYPRFVQRVDGRLSRWDQNRMRAAQAMAA